MLHIRTKSVEATKFRGLFRSVAVLDVAAEARLNLAVEDKATHDTVCVPGLGEAYRVSSCVWGMRTWAPGGMTSPLHVVLYCVLLCTPPTGRLHLLLSAMPHEMLQDWRGQCKWRTVRVPSSGPARSLPLSSSFAHWLPGLQQERASESSEGTSRVRVQCAVAAEPDNDGADLGCLVKKAHVHQDAGASNVVRSKAVACCWSCAAQYDGVLGG